MSQLKTSYEQLPLMLNADQLSKALGISRAGAYELMHKKRFPPPRICQRMMVSNAQFIQWVNRASDAGLRRC